MRMFMDVKKEGSLSGTPDFGGAEGDWNSNHQTFLMCWPAKYRTEKIEDNMAKTWFSLVSPANTSYRPLVYHYDNAK
jgi:hypothetical protein